MVDKSRIDVKCYFVEIPCAGFEHFLKYWSSLTIHKLELTQQFANFFSEFFSGLKKYFKVSDNFRRRSAKVFEFM